MQHFTAIGTQAAQFDGGDEKSIAFDGLAGIDAQRRGGLAVENDTVQDAEIVAAVEQQTGILVQGAVRQPFEDQHRRQHGPAVEDVRFQHRMRGTIQNALEGMRQRRRRRIRAATVRERCGQAAPCTVAARLGSTTTSTASPGGERSSSTR